MTEHFLQRWSRRKAESAAGSVPALQPSMPPAASSATDTAGSIPQAKPAAALPTLADVAALASDAAYAPFVARGLDQSVHRAAMKQLFSDMYSKAITLCSLYDRLPGNCDVCTSPRLRLRAYRRLGSDDRIYSLAGTVPRALAGTRVSTWRFGAALQKSRGVTPRRDTDGALCWHLSIVRCRRSGTCSPDRSGSIARPMHTANIPRRMAVATLTRCLTFYHHTTLAHLPIYAYAFDQLGRTLNRLPLRSWSARHWR